MDTSRGNQQLGDRDIRDDPLSVAPGSRADQRWGVRQSDVPVGGPLPRDSRRRGTHRPACPRHGSHRRRSANPAVRTRKHEVVSCSVANDLFPIHLKSKLPPSTSRQSPTRSTKGTSTQEDQAARNSLSHERVAHVSWITAPDLNDKAALGTIGSARDLCLMAPDYRTVPDYRHLQLICERQVRVTSNEETRKAFEELAEEYRKMAEFLEHKLQEQQDH
jgi:hypothetical protein